MAKYIATDVISTGSGFVRPGEEIELSDTEAKILFRKQVIKPAELRAKPYEVKDHGTDN